MKTIYKSIISLAGAAAMISGLTSCSDFLEEYSQDLAKVESWQDLDEVLLGDGYMHSARLIPGSYGPSREGDLDGLNILHYLADEITLSVPDHNDHCNYVESMFPFYTWQGDTGISSEKKYVGGDDSYWNDLYKRINVCNMVISLIDEQPEARPDDAVEKMRVKGEAYFLRGLCEFFLVNLYAKPYEPGKAVSEAGIPLKTSEYVEDRVFTRASLADSYAQIISDFEEAALLLKGKTVKSKYHGDEAAANLMLSRTYLYMQNWDKAIEYADKVLAANNSLLNLHTVAKGANSVSLGSPETIFTMGQYLIAANFADDTYGDYAPKFSLSDNVINLYEHGDLRDGLYFGMTTDGYYSNAFLKYNLQRQNWGGLTDVSSYCLLRTPEAYLNKAEALAYKGNDNESCQTLDPYLRTRMDAAQPLSLSGNELIEFIRDERAREFLLEGHRWFDLRRYTVCPVYPWSKTIQHTYHYYASNSYAYSEVYTLEENDLGYTLPIPRAIREQNIEFGNNPQPGRTPQRVDMSSQLDYGW